MNTPEHQVTGKQILVNDGVGHIGSHTLMRLLETEAEVHVVDNFSNSSPEILWRFGSLSQRSFTFDEVDIQDAAMPAGRAGSGNMTRLNSKSVNPNNA
jgi:nucleoside-diphosphate-sugar epimerase